MEEGVEPAPPPLPTAAVLDEPAAQTGNGWLRQGARVLALRAPRWQGLDARPLAVALLVGSSYLLGFLMQRAVLDGEPQPHWPGFLDGWAGAALTAWLCWVVARSNGTVTAAALFALCCAASLVFGMLAGAGMLVLRATFGPNDAWPTGLQWTAWLLPVTWAGLVQMLLFWRVAAPGAVRTIALLLAPLPLVLNAWLAPVVFWWPDAPVEAAAEAEATDSGLVLTDAVVHAQPALLADALQALRPPQHGRVNLYGLTYAPYASEDVFMRESGVVARTMRERFGAEGRLVELVVNPATSTSLPWATPLNLRLAIQRMATVMDRERDVLFLHLTSHGGADGQLASDTAPLQTAPMTPQLLKRWLDEAGVRWRVISVSACYAGSWIAPLAGDGTLVMTAADAEHTSYGCGKRSPLTFFGRAMFEEELRKTWSFTEAHAAARKVIELREQEAGKSDGYSNPQISEGAGIRCVLQQLATQQRGG